MVEVNSWYFFVFFYFVIVVVCFVFVCVYLSVVGGRERIKYWCVGFCVDFFVFGFVINKCFEIYGWVEIDVFFRMKYNYVDFGYKYICDCYCDGDD